MQLSNNIRAFRKERSLTQEQLAQALGVTAGAVYKWEAGLSAPDISLLIELADLFDTSVDVLLGCEVRNNKRGAAVERLKDYAHRRDERGLVEADKLLVRYPNCFEIVHQSADLYWLFGFMRRDKKLLRRSIKLMERRVPPDRTEYQPRNQRALHQVLYCQSLVRHGGGGEGRRALQAEQSPGDP